jgi:hypothetical protein
VVKQSFQQYISHQVKCIYFKISIRLKYYLKSFIFIFSFEKFNSLCLLAEGRTAYFGPARDAKPYFARFV